MAPTADRRSAKRRDWRRDSAAMTQALISHAGFRRGNAVPDDHSPASNSESLELAFRQFRLRLDDRLR
jgi:hypothetical protein